MTDKELLEEILAHLVESGALSVAWGGRPPSEHKDKLLLEYQLRLQEKISDTNISR